MTPLLSALVTLKSFSCHTAGSLTPPTTWLLPTTTWSAHFHLHQKGFGCPVRHRSQASGNLLLIQPQSLRRAPERATATFAPEIATTTSAAKAACILAVWLWQPVQSCGYFLHCCCRSVLSLLLLSSCYQLCLLYWQQAGRSKAGGEEGL